jgi:antitoxin component YwqK of YwqJK toxin-antitoxin module
LEYRQDGFTIPEHKKGSNMNDPEIVNATLLSYLDVIQSFTAFERYHSEDWTYSTKENATYRSSIVKIGNLYEITDSWITGEIQMRGMASDISGLKRVGAFKFYFKNGNLETEVTFVNNKPHGVQKRFDEKGKLIEQITWVNGVKDGACIETDDEGGYWEGFYKNDRIHGTWKGFYPNGKPKAENVWENGLLKEINFYKDPNGNPLDKGTLVNGSGTRKKYDNKGKLMAILTFEAGKFISEYQVDK